MSRPRLKGMERRVANVVQMQMRVDRHGLPLLRLLLLLCLLLRRISRHLPLVVTIIITITITNTIIVTVIVIAEGTRRIIPRCTASSRRIGRSPGGRTDERSGRGRVRQPSHPQVLPITMLLRCRWVLVSVSHRSSSTRNSSSDSRTSITATAGATTGAGTTGAVHLFLYLFIRALLCSALLCVVG